MGQKKAPEQKKRPGITDLWRMLLLLVGIVAVVQELRKPKADRTWHGTVAGFVPYDFRKPTADRFRETYWNPDGPIVSSKAMGVGWAINLGAIKKMVG